MAEADSTPTSTARPAIDIPDEILSVLPSDPFEQLDVARKITSIALSTRLSKLESECASLQSCLDDKDDLISDLQAQLKSLESSLAETSDRLLRADQEKERLLKENNSLSSTVNKLNRDVSKLEVFRKTLMQSLEEDGEDSAGGYKVVATSHESSSSTSPVGGGGARLPPSKYSSIRNQFSEAGNSFNDDTEIDASRPRISQSLLLASQSSTPRLTPPGSPQNLSASTSPTITSKPASPRRHSLSFSTTRGMFDDRTSTFSSLPSSQQSSITSSADIGSQTGRARVDGKEFFRQVRTRLSYEQFAAFLANVKELNSHKQTKEETLRKADEIFGPDNKDLYTIFEGLITRTSH